MRDFKILFSSQTISTASICANTAVPSIPALTYCQCPLGKYFASGGCLPCDSTCESCFGPDPSQCLSCPINYSYDGTHCILCSTSCRTCFGTKSNQCFTCHDGEYLYWDFTCKTACPTPQQEQLADGSTICDPQTCSGGKFAYTNGSCLSTCPSPFVIQTQGLTNMCNFPCGPQEYLYINNTCSSFCESLLVIINEGSYSYCRSPCSTEYLYWDGSCSSTCLLPHKSTTYLGYPYCEYPCNDTAYLFWNTSCISTCPSPYQSSTHSNKNYCNYLCTDAQYLCWNGTCGDSCDIPYRSRTEAGKKYCDYPCTISQYLAWNGSCFDSCNLPYNLRTEASRNYCDYPCANAQYLAWNGSCFDTCMNIYSIRVEAGLNYCDYPCTTSQYLAWDGSCLSICTFPYKQRIEAAKNYCDFPCTETQYLAWDGSCISSCSTPPYQQRTQSNKKYCDYPCNSNQYLYWNGTCSSSCSYPYKTRIKSAYNYCDLPCNTSEYLTQDGSCTSICPSPKQFESVKLCPSICSDPKPFYYPDLQKCKAICLDPYKSTETSMGRTCSLSLSEQDKQEILKLSSISQTAQTASIIGLAVSSLLSSVGIGVISSPVLSKLLSYTRYLNITHSARLEYMYQSYQPSFGALDFPFIGMTTEMSSKFVYGTPPLVFGKYEVVSSFLANFWNGIASFAIFVAALICSKMLNWITSDAQKKYWVLLIVSKFKNMIQNYTVSQFYEGYSDIIMFFIIELRSAQFDGTAHNFSIVLSLMYTVCSFVLLYLHLRLIIHYQKQIRQVSLPEVKETIEQFENKYKGFEVLFADFKPLSISCQAYLFIYSTRNIIFSLIITLLFKHPMVQTILIVLLNSAMLTYLISKRPFKSRYTFIQQLSYEILLLFVNLSLMIMTALERSYISLSLPASRISETIIVANLISTILPNIYIIPTTLVSLVTSYRQGKALYRRLVVYIRKWRAKKNRISVAGASHNIIRLDRSGVHNDAEDNSAFGDMSGMSIQRHVEEEVMSEKANIKKLHTRPIRLQGRVQLSLFEPIRLDEAAKGEKEQRDNAPMNQSINTQTPSLSQNPGRSQDLLNISSFIKEG